MKACVRRLRVELKMSNKGTNKISEFVLRNRAIAESLMAIDDSISEYDQIDSILQGLPEDYIPSIMMAYGKTDPMYIYDVECLLYINKLNLTNIVKNLLHLVPQPMLFKIVVTPHLLHMLDQEV